MEKRAVSPVPRRDIDARKAIDLCLHPQRPRIGLRHTAPSSFRRGHPVPIECVADAQAGRTPTTVTLHYRHVNQAEPYRIEQMQALNDRWTAAIPAVYTDSPYPLQYYFELRDAAGHARLFPGLGLSLFGQPYFVIRQRA